MSKIQQHYEQSICWLFQILQNLLSNNSMQTIRSYLYYAKIIMDQYCNQCQFHSLPNNKSLQEELNQILQILIYKSSNSNLEIKLTQFRPIHINNIQYQNYSNPQQIKNPFNILQLKKTIQNNQITQAIAQLLILSLTKSEFRKYDGEFIVLGCVKAVEKYKDMKHHFFNDINGKFVSIYQMEVIQEIQSLYSCLLKEIQVMTQ